MKKMMLVLAVAASLGLPQTTFAADQAPTYDQAIRCAALNTLLSAVVGGDDTTDKDKAEAAAYDEVTAKWLDKAAGMNSGGQDAALADYLTAATSMAETLTSKSDEAAGLLTTDVITCTQLEISTFGSSPGIDG